MQTETVSVRAGSVTGSTVVQIFSDLQDAVAYFEGLEDADGAAYVTKLVNNAHRLNVMNAKRAELRPASPFKQLRDKVKSDASARERLNALLSELGIDAADL